MKIRRKTIIIIIGVFLLTLAVTSLISRSFLLRGFEKLETAQVQRNIGRLHDAVSREFDSLDLTVNDWASWDDTYRFITDLNREYVKSNLGEQSVANLRINLMVYVNPGGRVVFGKFIDAKTHEMSPLSDEFLENIRSGSPLVTFKGVDDHAHGILLLERGPLYVASRPILTSEKEGPIRGALIFGRNLDQDAVVGLSKMIRAPLMLARFNDSMMPIDFRKARYTVQTGESAAVSVLNKNIVSGYTAVKDVYGEPALLFRVDVQRDVIQQGGTIINYFMLIFLGAVVLFGAVFVMLIEKTLISPVVRLSGDIATIGNRRDLGGRLSLKGTDELSSLATSINEMLSSLEDSDAGRRQAQEALAIGEERYRTTLENVTDIIYSCGTDGMITFVTPNVGRWGYKTGDVIGRNILEFVHPDDRELVKKDFEIAVARGASFPTVCRLVSKSGESFYVEEISNVIREGGKVTQLTGVIRDISERRKAEADLRKVQKKLDEVRRLSDIGTLAATVAHELRNPLSVIQTAAYNIKRKVDDPDIARHVEGIKKKVEESNQIINNLLFYSRIREARPEGVKICWVLDEAVESAKARFTRHDVVLERKYHGNADIESSVDPAQMREVFNNIINNAYQAIENDAGKIKIEVAENRLGYVEISIEDNGCGIDEADIERVFDPFFTTKTRGTGLGLTITAEFVRLNNGTIKIESVKGEGTKVVVALPVKSEMRV